MERKRQCIRSRRKLVKDGNVIQLFCELRIGERPVCPRFFVFSFFPDVELSRKWLGLKPC